MNSDVDCLESREEGGLFLWHMLLKKTSNDPKTALSKLYGY